MSWLFNRYTLTLGSIVLLVGIWNIYVALNNDGIITGKVVGVDNNPVAGATVVLNEKNLLVTIAKARAITNESGEFRFTNHNLYRLYLEAFKEGHGRTPPLEFRLYFKRQNIFIDKPLRLVESK
jgi:hypothetical protein